MAEEKRNKGTFVPFLSTRSTSTLNRWLPGTESCDEARG